MENNFQPNENTSYNRFNEKIIQGRYFTENHIFISLKKVDVSDSPTNAHIFNLQIAIPILIIADEILLMQEAMKKYLNNSFL